MSAAEHRSEADAHERKARRHADVSEPGGKAVAVIDPIERPDRDYGSEFRWPTLVYTAPGGHDSAGARHLRHATAHRDAAGALERFEDEECGEFPPATRAVCPLVSGAESVVEIDGGVRVGFADGVSAEAVVDHLRCHQAFGRTRGFEGMAGCPLYIPNLTMTPGPDGHSVDIVATTPAELRELRTRARSLVEK